MTSNVNEARPRALTRPVSRRGLMRGAAMTGAGALAMTVVGGAVVPTIAQAAPTTGSGSVAPAVLAAPLDSDLDILNYALTLEYLETAAYKVINDAGVLSGRAATYFQAFGAHEAAHVDAIAATIRKLGGNPVSEPRFDFSSVPTDPAGVVKFFQMVEAVGASAYLGAAPSIRNPDVLEAALSIHAVEAEHAAALADLVAPGSDLFAPMAFEKPRTPDEVLAIVQPFLAGMPSMPRTGAGGGASQPDHATLGVLGVGAGLVAVLARHFTGETSEKRSFPAAYRHSSSRARLLTTRW